MLQEQQVSEGLRAHNVELSDQLALMQTANAQFQEPTSTYHTRFLESELDNALRTNSEQYSSLTRKLEYMKRVLTSLLVWGL